MVYRLLADGVVVVHFAFIVFIAVGGLLAWRWRWLLWPHVAAVAWGAGIVAIGWTCPLTPIEKVLRDLGGEGEYRGGFVDRYIEGVVYPEQYTAWLRALAALLIALGWLGAYRRSHRTGRVGGPAGTA